METKQTLFICMGSACHQLGVYDVLPLLQGLIQENGLDDRLEIKGAFCLGACARGVVLKLDDDFIVDVNKQNARDKFTHEVMTRLKGPVKA